LEQYFLESTISAFQLGFRLITRFLSSLAVSLVHFPSPFSYRSPIQARARLYQTTSMGFNVFATIVALASASFCHFSKVNADLVPLSFADCTAANLLPYCCPRPNVGLRADGQRRPFNPDAAQCTLDTSNTCAPDRSFCCRQITQLQNDPGLETSCHWAMTDAIPNGWVERSFADYERVAAAQFLATQCKIVSSANRCSKFFTSSRFRRNAKIPPLIWRKLSAKHFVIGYWWVLTSTHLSLHRTYDVS